MRKISAVLVVLLLSGCASTGSTEWLTKSSRAGYKDYDPCIRCGEKWDQIPNEPFEAQKRWARGERW
jgi:uncharacterized protein YceK